MKLIRSSLSWLKEKSRPIRRRYGVRAGARIVSDAISLKIAHARRSRSGALHIGITGSSGKSTTTALLADILGVAGTVHAQVYENTLPQLAKTLRTAPSGADFVVAEIGATIKGSIRPMANLLRPQVVIVTKVGLEHYSVFRGKEAVANEKGALVEALRVPGLAILNADDPNVMNMASRTTVRVVTFGREKEADYRVLEAKAGFPGRLSIKVQCHKGVFDIDTPFVGEDFWLAAVAAFSAAVEMGVEPQEIIKKIGGFIPPWNRCGVISVPGGPDFIIDTVKAPNESIPSAMRIIESANASRKRVVVGYISDYTGGPRKGYPLAYRLAADCADQVIFVGEYGHRARAAQEDLATGRFVDFSSAREASDYIRNTVLPGEVILLKGSQTFHLERIALSWTHDVRCWENNCGKFIDCMQCGFLEVPYERHREARREIRNRQNLKKR